MIAYVTVGSDDIARAKRFYAAFLPALDYELKEGPEGLSYTLPVQPGQSPTLPDFYVKPSFDGRPATAGNGTLLAFQARSQQQVRELHCATHEGVVAELALDLAAPVRQVVAGEVRACALRLCASSEMRSSGLMWWRSSSA